MKMRPQTNPNDRSARPASFQVAASAGALFARKRCGAHLSPFSKRAKDARLSEVSLTIWMPPHTGAVCYITDVALLGAIGFKTIIYRTQGVDSTKLAGNLTEAGIDIVVPVAVSAADVAAAGNF